MVTLLWAVKGGSGTTVVASLLALDPARASLLIDLDGDAPAALGIPAPDRPGVFDWLVADGPPSQLIDLVVDVDDQTALLPYGLAASRSLPVATTRWRELVEWARAWEQRHDGVVIIDAGTGALPDALATGIEVRWLVTRACYLSLRRAVALAVRPTGVVLIAEAGRSLRSRDVQRSLAAPIIAVLDADPAIARCVDSGLLVSRVPRGVRRSLRRAQADGDTQGVGALDEMAHL